MAKVRIMSNCRASALCDHSTLRWVMLHTAAKFVVRVSVRVRVGVRVEELRTGVASIEVRYAIGFG